MAGLQSVYLCHFIFLTFYIFIASLMYAGGGVWGLSNGPDCRDDHRAPVHTSATLTILYQTI